jgi:hypothetical protein
MLIENELWPQDKALFQKMEESWRTDNEHLFFQTLRRKMECENAPWPEVLISEYDNKDELYLLRQTYDEFMLGRGKSRNEWQSSEQHKMSLADTLQINLKGANLLDKDISFFDWLRQCDYMCVRYDHSNDGNKM